MFLKKVGSKWNKLELLLQSIYVYKGISYAFNENENGQNIFDNIRRKWL